MPKVLSQDVTVNFREFGSITVPKGTETTHQTAMGIDETYNFVNQFGWIDTNYPEFANILKMDAQNYGINIPAEFIVDTSKPKTMRGLTLPIFYKDGEIKDGLGKTIIIAERDPNNTPLSPAGQDAILQLACHLINEAYQYDKASTILKKLGY